MQPIFHLRNKLLKIFYTAHEYVGKISRPHP